VWVLLFCVGGGGGRGERVFQVSGGVPGFFGCSEMFRDVPGCSGVPVFRCSGVPYSSVPRSTTCPILVTNFQFLLFISNPFSILVI